MHRSILATASLVFTLTVVGRGFDQNHDTNNDDVSLALPHVAVGGPWDTEFIVVNASDQPRNFLISFFGDIGQPLVLPIAGVGNMTAIWGVVPAHGSVQYLATDTTGPPRSGWASVTADESMTVQAVFRNHAGTNLHYEAAVPSNAGASGFVMSFDATSFAETGEPLYTGLAVVNLDTWTFAAITCIARDANGTEIPGGISLAAVSPRGHYANWLFPNLTGKRGTLDCTSNTKVAALGLRFIGTGAFTSISVRTK